MNRTEPKKKENGLRRWMAPLIPLWPALLTLMLVLTTLPFTRPALQVIPELLELPAEPVEVYAETPAETEAETEVETESVADASYTDGVYTGSAQGYGGTVTVQVTVEDGKITRVEILSAEGETASFFRRAKSVIDAVLTKQTWEVDVVSGATYSSRGILGAIQNALIGEKVKNEPAPRETAVAELSSDSFEEPAGYVDGIYYGSATGFGGTIEVEVVISGGKIASIRIVRAAGETGAYLSQAEAVIARMLEANSPNVDVVSGATYSSNGIINATKRALNQAASSGEAIQEILKEPVPTEPVPPTEEEEPVEMEPVEIDPVEMDPDLQPTETYQDGTYTGMGEGFGGDIEIQVTIADGKITAIEILQAADETPSYLSRAKQVISSMLSGQTTDVDVVSGATYSSNGILEATRTALKQALSTENGESPTDPSVPSGTPELPVQPTTPAEEDRAADPLPVDPEEPTKPVDPEEPTKPTDPEDSTKPADPEDPPKPAGPAVTYLDGIYSASVLCTDEDLFTYIVNVTLSVTDGQLTEVKAEKLDDPSAYPEDNDAYFEDAASGRIYRGVWYEGVLNQILEKQSAAEIDVVSRATYSSMAIAKAAAEALEQALTSGGDDGKEPTKPAIPAEEGQS